MTENPNAFKHWFNPESVTKLANDLAAAAPFDADAFVGAACDGLEALELKDRVRHISSALRDHLDPDVPRAMQHILLALPAAKTSTEEVANGFILWPYCHFVETYALDHPELALDAMQELTMRFSAEFAVRPYLDRDPEWVLQWLTERLDHPNPHVRRWISEGTRPRLPWGMRLQKFVDDPTPLLPLLESLRHDPEEYVRRSVANNLNDIAKDHPQLVVDTVREWWPDAGEDERRLIKHALRTLVKQGDEGALEVLGFGPPDVTVDRFEIPATVAVGTSFSMQLEVVSGKDHGLIIDYAVHHVRADGSRSPKVFKWTTRELADGERLKLSKKHSMRVVTTRTYYPGEHLVEVFANGSTIASATFELAI